MNENRRVIEEDEIDLVELFRTLLKRKWFIAIFTCIITICAIVFAYTKTPVYSGSMVVEIGEVINNNEITKNNNEITNIFYIDNAYNLKEIITSQFGLKVDIPKKTNNILKISYQNSNIKKIDLVLSQVAEFIKKRHEDKVKLYSMNNSKVYMTKVVNKKVGKTPIKPKKKLIVVVAFVTGFILSVFLVFFLEFIKNIKNTDDELV